MRVGGVLASLLHPLDRALLMGHCIPPTSYHRLKKWKRNVSRWAQNCFPISKHFLKSITLKFISRSLMRWKLSWTDIRGHEMFHDDMIMYAIINDQQSVIAMITRSSPWSNLWILWTNGNSCMYEWNFQKFVHICMNSHLFIKFINLIMEMI